MSKKVFTAMKFRTVKYHVKQGLYGIMKNRLMAFASAITVAASAFILIISLCIVLNIDYLLEQIETTIGISVYIGDDVDDKDVQQIGEKIKNINHVTNVNYVSKEDALKWTMENWENVKTLEGLKDDNPLPRSFDITLEGIEFQESVINDLENLRNDFEKQIVSEIAKKQYEIEFPQNAVSTENSTENTSDSSNSYVSLEEYENAELSAIGTDGYTYIGIENIKHAMEASNVLVTANTAVRIISVILIIILSVISVGIIMNTIKLTVFIRKNEIGIMKYVGATDWFIRWPFIVEGVIIGIAGAIFPCLICWFSYDEAINIIYQHIPYIQNTRFMTDTELFAFIVPISLILGAALGAFGSATSIRKHLNV